MWPAIQKKIREWYIVGVGLCVIAGGLFLASFPTSPTAAVNAAPPAAAAPALPTARPISTSANIAPATTGATEAKDQICETPRNNRVAAAGASPAGGQAVAQATPIAGGDSAAGRRVFRKCQAWHSLEPGKNILGPSLAGIVGRKSGAEPRYSYSPAMKQANIVWDEKTLDGYLADPQKAIPGNKMPFPGLKTHHDRADVMAFLASPAGSQVAAANTPPQKPPAVPPATAEQNPGAASQPRQNSSGAGGGYLQDAKYTLRSGIAEGRMV
jgi:nitrite reductase (NO-forming)